MEPIRAFFRALFAHRAVPTLRALEARARRLSPSDRFIAGSLAVVMALSAAAMLASISLAFTTEVPARGGTYTEGLVGSPRFLNPLLAVSDTDRDLSVLIFSGLLRARHDGSLAPDVAERYEVSDDKRTYTFTLSPKARFHDGVPVTAEDVAFTVRAAQSPDIKSPRRADWEGVEVTVIDPHTVSFTLKTPYAPFIENATLGILPKHVWADVTAEEFPFSTLNTDPVGSGPYRLEKLRRNSAGIPVEYRLKAVTEGTTIPYIERFIFTIHPNAESLKRAINQGEIRAAHSIDTEGLIVPAKVHEAVYGRVFGVFMNQSENLVFAEASVREALDVAIDKEGLVDTVLLGHGAPVESPLPPRSVQEGAHEARPSEEDRLAEARTILENRGWTRGEDGVFAKTKSGKATRLSFSLTTSNNPELKRAAEIVAETWKSLGADVELRLFDQNDLNVGVIRPRKYDALLFGLVVGRDLDLYAFWHSSQRNDPGLNIGLFADIEADRKLEALRAETDPTLRAEKAAEVAAEIAEERGAIFLYAPYFVYVTPERLSGVRFGAVTTPSDRFLEVSDWYLAKERVWPIFTKRTNE